ncbi:MAG TPA: hypothetical protein VGJ66_26795 [Pyrinomonadaceae bacterium]|jgi:hypothetical protein
MTKLTLLALIFFSLTPATLGQVRNEPAEFDILESVFRYQIARCYRDRTPGMYFLSYLGQDPSDELIARLASGGFLIKGRSQMSQFKDRNTGKWSIILAVSDIELRSDRRADVRASCIAAWLDGRTYTYRVVRSNRRWIVTRSKVVGFS